VEPGARGRSNPDLRRLSRSCPENAFRVVFDWAVAGDLLSHMRGIHGVPLDDRLDAAYDTLNYHNDPDTTPEPDLVTDVFLPVV
jgi:hypothetical protein